MPVLFLILYVYAFFLHGVIYYDFIVLDRWAGGRAHELHTPTRCLPGAHANGDIIKFIQAAADYQGDMGHRWETNLG